MRRPAEAGLFYFAITLERKVENIVASRRQTGRPITGVSPGRT
jgi:hypothetical protein